MGDAPQFEDYYDLLGVDRSASRAGIMQAYREQVKRHHPDRQDGEPGVDAARMFKHLSRARSILSNPARRAEYDRLGHRAYLDQRGDDGALTPSADRSAVGHTGSEWSDPGTDGDAIGANDSTGATVVEGTDTTIEDLLGPDPLEDARSIFRRVWLVRLVTTTGLVGLALGPLGVAGMDVLILLSLAVPVLVGATGYSAMVRTPRETMPTRPPPSASVGILRPAVAARYRRGGLALLAVAVTLASTGANTLPWPQVTDIVIQGASPWIAPGTFDAPGLVDAVNVGLAVVLAVAAYAGSVLLALAVSASSWYRYHGGFRDNWPIGLDLPLLIGASVLWVCLFVSP